MSSGFPTRSDKNLAVQPEHIARYLNFRIYNVTGLHYHIAKTLALISCAVIAYAKIGFSHDVA